MALSKNALITIRAELHLHTVLSPCASIEMIPPLIISEALEKKINLIAVTDHNAIGNIEAVIEAAVDTGITVLPGIELQTREDIHSLCLFDSLDQIKEFYDEILPTFPGIKNNAEFFGEQFVVDAAGEFIKREERLLITASSLSLKEAVKKVMQFNGILIPAHVNRTTFGLLPVLGFVPMDVELPILELSRHMSFSEAINTYPQLAKCKLIHGGDAHTLDEIRGWNQFTVRKPAISELISALFEQNGRTYKSLRNKA